MLDFSEAAIEIVSLHLIGNKSRGEKAIFSDNPLELAIALEQGLLKFVLSPFISKDDFYVFSHHDDAKFNEIKSYSDEILLNRELFMSRSKKIASHLYNVGLHPNINAGELIVCLFSGITLGQDKLECLGIFKSETKDDFLTYSKVSDQYLEVRLNKGANLKGLDKGALILREEGGSELQLLVVDKKSADTQYWLDSFLNIEIKRSDSHSTQVFLETCLSFSKSQVAKELDKKDLISLNKHVSEYFSENTEFDRDEFFGEIRSETFGDRFEGYITDSLGDRDIDIDSGFMVDSKRASKSLNKIKNVIKLDTQIELKVNSQNLETLDNIERGYDEDKNMHYYKVYFNQEVE